MSRSTVLLLTLATLSAPAATLAAQGGPVTGSVSTGYAQSQSTPMQRGPHGPGRVVSSTPAPGVFVRADQPTALTTIAADATHTELRLDHGRANINVHDPAPDSLVLVDLPGGQTQLLKNGFYTFNADTNTVRVFSGEADAFPAAGTRQDKPIKVKGDREVVFSGAQTKEAYSDPYYARQDILSGNNERAYGSNSYARNEPGYGPPPPPVYNYAPYGYGPYGDGFYEGYPYYAYGYPYYGWGYPYGLGFGWGGGFYGRGFGYGGYRGFGGGGFHGRR